MEATSPGQRFDSLFQVYAAWDRDRDGRWIKRTQPLDWTLLKAQAVAESGLDPDAESPVGAEGLAQFMAATFEEWSTKQFQGPPPPSKHITPFDPEDAIWAQADMMAWLLGIFGGNKRKALASYNWGYGHVKRAIEQLDEQWERQLPEETRAYLARILGA